MPQTVYHVYAQHNALIMNHDMHTFTLQYYMIFKLHIYDCVNTSAIITKSLL